MFNSLDDEEKIYRIIDYRFKNKNLLLQALTRQSALNEGKQLNSLKSFQQLEFIGDKILDLVIGDILLEHFPDATEGKLTIETAKYVNNKGPLATVARRLKLNKFMIIGYGEEIHNNVRYNDKVLSDAMEALLGALWLDSNRDYDFLKKFIIKHWECVGLPQPLKLEDLQLITMDYNASLTERIKRLKSCFKKPIPQEILNAFLAGTAYQENEEILILTLSQKPDLLSINNAFINAILTGGCDTEIAILLKHGADANFIYPPENCAEWEYTELDNQYTGRRISALGIAVTSCSLETIGLMLHYGANPNWNQGLSTKKTYSFRNLVQTAIKDTLDVALPEFPEVAEEFSQTFFPGFCENDSQRITSSNIFSIFASANSKKPKKVEKFNNKFTVLHEIVNYNNYGIADVEKIIKLLIKYDANPNAADYEGDTPLHIVARDDTHNIYDLLIELGSDPNIKNNKGETPQQIKQIQEYSSSDEEFLFNFNINKPQ